jgi:lysozyme family protein
MRENWDKAFDQVIIYEGGYVNHPKDPGGPTNLGITQSTLSSYLGRRASVQEVRALTKAAVKPIYKKRFWDVLRCDDLPGGVDLAVYDFGVNSGTSRAARYLQSVVGVSQDGKIGPATISACNRIKKLPRFRAQSRTTGSGGFGA